VQKLIDEGRTEAEVIAAKPSKEFDARFVRQGNFLGGDGITRLAYQSLKGYTPPARPPAPASFFDRGSSKQAWQEPGIAAIQAKCKAPPAPFGLGGNRAGASVAAAPPPPVNPPPEPATPSASTAIPGVIAAGQAWKVVWQWEGNNADGPIADSDGTLLFANNDASNVMRLDPATGLAKIVFADTNTSGAVSRGKGGQLFMVSRGLGGGIVQLEPKRRMFANTFAGEPLECLSGSLNDLAADAHGGVYATLTGGVAGVLHVNPQGVVSAYGRDVRAANGIVLSRDEKALYVTSGADVVAFDVRPDGTLTNQHLWAKLRSGQGGDGAAIDTEGRLYAATGRDVDVFSAQGEFLGSIPGPQGLHGVAFAGRDKKTLYGIVFYGGWGTPSARNRIIAIPTIAQGYLGRAK
jgi:gluconolactonase